MEDDSDLVRGHAKNECDQGGEQDGVAQNDATRKGVERPHLGECQANDHRGNGEADPGPGSGRANIKQCRSIGRRRFHPNECAKSPDKEWRAGDEIRQAGPDPVDAGQDVMPHLMAEQDEQ